MKNANHGNLMKNSVATKLRLFEILREQIWLGPSGYVAGKVYGEWVKANKTNNPVIKISNSIYWELEKRP